MTYQPKIVRCRLKMACKTIPEIRERYAGQGLTYRDFENIQRANEQFDGLILPLTLWEYDDYSTYHLFTWDKVDDERMMMALYYSEQTHPYPRYKAALDPIAGEYDYCLIDNAPDINISTINALVASDDVIIPIKIDKYAFDGLAELKEQIEDTRDDLNPRLRLAGCLITCFQRTDADKQGEEWLRSQPEYPVFDTHIRYSEKVTESTFAESPIAEYSRRSGAAMDYIAFVREYLERGKK